MNNSVLSVMKIKLIATLIAFLIFLPIGASSQIFDILEIDTVNYPEIKAWFVAKDDNSNDYSDLTIDDFVIAENGINISFKASLDCIEETYIAPISVVLVMDVSSSMNEETGNGEKRIKWCSDAAKAFIDEIELSAPSGIAILPFAGVLYPGSGFKSEKDPLYNYLNSLPPTSGTTDFNLPFLEIGGAIDILRQRPENQRKVIVMISDGNPSPKYPLDVPKTISRAKSANIQIYSIIINEQPASEMQTIAKETGGKYQAVWDKTSLLNLYREIAGDIQKGFFCNLTWEGLFICDTSNRKVDVDVFFSRLNETEEFSYWAPLTSIPMIEYSDSLLLFARPGFGVSQRVITLHCLHSPMDVNEAGIVFDNDEIVIADWGGPAPPFTMQPGETRDITLEYINPDEADSREGHFFIRTEPCPTDQIVKLIAPCSGTVVEEVIFEDVQAGSFGEKTIECIYKNTTLVSVSGSVSLEGTDKDFFEITAGAGAFTLDQNECLDITIRFKPQDNRQRTASVYFNVPNYCGNPVTNLRGTGVVSDLPLPSYDAGLHRVLTINPFTYIIENTSGNDLEIEQIGLEKDDGNFAIKDMPTMPYTLADGEAINLEMEFVPQNESLQPLSDNIWVKIAMNPDTVRAQLIGRSFLPKINATKQMNFPDTEVGAVSALENINIENPSETGDLYIERISLIGAAPDFHFETGTTLTDFSIAKSGGMSAIPLYFEPTGTGDKTAYVEIISDAAPGPQTDPRKRDTVMLTGKGWEDEPPPPDTLVIEPVQIDFGSLSSCSATDTVVTITNTTQSVITIENLYLDGNDPHVFSSQADILQIPVSGQARITVGFMPDEVGSFDAEMKIETSIGDTSVYLTGNGFELYLTATLLPLPDEYKPTIPGLEIPFDFSVEVPAINKMNITGDVIISMKYYPKMFEYRTSTVSGTNPANNWSFLDNAPGKVNFRGNLNDGAGDIVSGTVILKVFLSDEYQKKLSIEAKSEDMRCLLPAADSIDIKVETCYTEGSLILTNPENFTLYPPEPNPAGDRVTMKFSLGLDCHARIELLNSIGEIVKKYDLGNIGHGAYEKEIDLTGLPSGIYFFRLVTEIYSEVVPVVISP